MAKTVMRATARNRVRIIGGLWRSRLIAFPARAELRPTPDRVRETLFNWLGQDLTGRHCLDLFAGSGALGFEAASRGAQRVVMIADRGDYDVVLLDPPFGADYLPKVLAMLPPRLAADGTVYIEAPRALELSGEWEVWRSARAGAVVYQLLKWTGHGG